MLRVHSNWNKHDWKILGREIKLFVLYILEESVITCRRFREKTEKPSRSYVCSPDKMMAAWSTTVAVKMLEEVRLGI